jgi:hypothetical protein
MQLKQLPKYWMPLPASHAVREFALNLTELGLAETTEADILKSDFWLPHADKLHVGDEFRVRGPLV